MSIFGKQKASESDVLKALSQVKDPDLHRDIVSLNFVKNLKIDDSVVSFDINLTTPACPVKERLRDEAKQVVMSLEGVTQVNVNLTAEVRQHAGLNRSTLSGVRNIVAVGSGKGGVGKSTVAANLAVGLALTGARVGLLDADIYGPTIPIMLGRRQQAQFRENRIIPLENHGITFMSMGLFVPGDKPLIWRGPMAHKALQQCLFEVEWGALDYLIADLPPGCLTSDTLVFTEQGPVPISEIREGMHVYSFDGHFNKARYKSPWELHAALARRRVLAVIPQGKATVYQLKTATRSIRGTEDHPILAVRRSKRENTRFYHYSLEWVKLGDLKRGDIILVVKKAPAESGAPLRLPRPDLRAVCMYTGLKVGNLIGRTRTVRVPSTRRLVTQTFWRFEANKTAKTDIYGAGLIRGSTGQGLRHEYIGFEKIKEVKLTGVEEVYDLHVEGEHNFVANGFIVHNTGDVHLTLAQSVPVTGSVIVSTPQDVGLMISMKTLRMFQQVNVPVLGIIENMSYHICSHCGAREEIFGHGGAAKASEDLRLPFLGEIPIDVKIREWADAGTPIILADPDSPSANAYRDIVGKLAQQVSIQNYQRVPLEIVEVPA
jgi:Mrp family chromosome partitioning ATPase